MAGEPPQPINCNSHLGLARIYYQWNDLEAAEQQGQLCLEQTRQMEIVDTVASSEVLLARLRLKGGRARRNRYISEDRSIRAPQQLRVSDA